MPGPCLPLSDGADAATPRTGYRNMRSDLSGREVLLSEKLGDSSSGRIRNNDSEFIPEAYAADMQL